MSNKMIESEALDALVQYAMAWYAVGESTGGIRYRLSVVTLTCTVILQHVDFVGPMHQLVNSNGRVSIVCRTSNSREYPYVILLSFGL